MKMHFLELFRKMWQKIVEVKIYCKKNESMEIVLRFIYLK